MTSQNIPKDIYLDINESLDKCYYSLVNNHKINYPLLFNIFLKSIIKLELLFEEGKLGELDYLLLLRLVCTLPLMMNSFVDYCKLLPEKESEQIPLETNIRELTELVMAKGKYVPSWAGVVKKYLVEISERIEKYKCVLSDTLETIGSFSSSINYYVFVRSVFLLSLTTDEKLINECNRLLAKGGVI